MSCDHSGTYSGMSRYLREAGELRLVLVCDECGAERGELSRLSYRPAARPGIAQVPKPQAGTRGLGR